jgi:hypothetical protein
MREATKEELEDDIYELTRGALVRVFLDPWTGRVVRREEGLKLACSKWGSVNYTRDELRQIRDWLKRHLLVPVTPRTVDEAAAEQAEMRA